MCGSLLGFPSPGLQIWGPPHRVVTGHPISLSFSKPLCRGSPPRPPESAMPRNLHLGACVTFNPLLS